MNEELSIELCHLTVGYSKRGVQLSQLHPLGTCCVASNLNATALPGTLTCLIGHNGTGKSTLLRTIARLQPSMTAVC